MWRKFVEMVKKNGATRAQKKWLEYEQQEHMVLTSC